MRQALGTGPSLVSINPRVDLDSGNAHLPARGTFDWNSVLSDFTIKQPMPSFRVKSIYRPLPFGDDGRLSTKPGETIASVLTPLARDTWNKCFPLQDKRSDTGHAEVVVYLTDQLAKIHGLPPEEREASIIAAILHDTGWSRIENIETVFRELNTTGKSDKHLRILHQEYAVELANQLLAGYSRLDEVIETVAHHDTRELPVAPNLITTCMWDADMLSRVTAPGIYNGHFHIGKTVQETALIAEKWLRLERPILQMPASMEVGLIEYTRAIKVYGIPA